MALYIYDKHSNYNEEIIKKIGNNVKCLDSYSQIQSEYCMCIENEIKQRKLFFDRKEVKEFLNSIGVEYAGNYLLKSKEWHPQKQFVTHLNYIEQLCCVILQQEYMTYIIDKDDYVEIEYLGYHRIFKQRDAIIIDDTFSDWYSYSDAADDGIEVFINGKTTDNTKPQEMDNLFRELRRCNSYLDREVENQAFTDFSNISQAFLPYHTIYKEYVIKNESDPFSKEQLIKNSDEVWGGDIKVIVNGDNYFSSIFRRYPIHYLFKIDSEWKYASDISYKYPSLDEIFTQIFFDEGKYDSLVKRDSINPKSVHKVFALVLNCDETCYVREYWKHVAFIVEYDIDNNIIEICDIDSGIKRFHELLQESTDLA